MNVTTDVSEPTNAEKDAMITKALDQRDQALHRLKVAEQHFKMYDRFLTTIETLLKERF